MPQTVAIDFFSPQVTGITDQYFNERKENFPNWYQLSQVYYSLPRSQQAEFELQFPEWAEYRAWQRDWYNEYPDLRPVFM